MLLLILTLGFGAGPVFEFSSAAATSLLESPAYADAVLTAAGRPESVEGAP